MSKQSIIWSIVSGMLLSFSSCQDEYYEKEIYKKIVYIVHSENKINPFTHPFKGAPTEGFISLYCSGSLMPDADIEIEIGLDDELIAKYNYIEFEEDESRYVKALKAEHYNIPSFHVKIRKGEPFGTMPIFVTSEGLSPDSMYVIPLKIKSISPNYEISKDLSSILYAIKLENAYSGLYRMTGSLQEEGGASMPQQVFKDKTLLPLNEFTCRMFLGTENELAENIPLRSLQFTVQSDHSIMITENNNVRDLGGSNYDPETESFILNYSYIISEKRYEIREKLIRLKE
ncbi:BT_3044 domain-containing protein [Proteiniphilum sp. UBA5384]|uniref:BT_3044 domain-containing protein n=1 Tax=Proteiniphilum sp. UBA5384 TaxID=1947279 RepID=UPI0025E14219|nr:DUF4361 domain-containing protein [Proteiniphilum sp. UBA5384]